MWNRLCCYIVINHPVYLLILVFSRNIWTQLVMIPWLKFARRLCGTLKVLLPFCCIIRRIRLLISLTAEILSGVVDMKYRRHSYGLQSTALWNCRMIRCLCKQLYQTLWLSFFNTTCNGHHFVFCTASVCFRMSKLDFVDIWCSCIDVQELFLIFLLYWFKCLSFFSLVIGLLINCHVQNKFL